MTESGIEMFNQFMKDIRYSEVRSQIANGQIKKIDEIFNVAKKTEVCSDLHMNYNRFNAAIKHHWNFRIRELATLARLFKVDPKKLVDMAYEQPLSTVRDS